jgi:hypothetical protein
MSNKIICSDGKEIDLSKIGNEQEIIGIHNKIFTGTQTSKVDTVVPITKLEVTLTPTSPDSKFLLMANINYDHRRSNGGGGFFFTRDDEMIGIGDAHGIKYRVMTGFSSNNDGNQTLMNASLLLEDTPNTTNPVTYKVCYKAVDSSYMTYINRGRSDNNHVDDPRGASTFTIIEYKE